ncbi:MAG: hypothetical protein WD512_05685, partial [Candidatus Paceibacterota bacterium]
KDKCYYIFRHTSYGNGFIMTTGSAMLRRFDRSFFDHAEILYFDNIFKEWYCIGGTFNGVREMKLTEWMKLYKHSFQICEIPTNKPHRLIKRDAKRMIGTPYDFISLAFHLLRPLTIWIGRKGRKALKKVYCTEFCGYVSGLPEWHELSVSGLYNLTSNRFPINQMPS